MKVLPVAQLSERVAEEVSTFGGRTILLVSGGSQIPKLAEVFRKFVSTQLDFSKLTIALIDERFDRDPEHKDSNYTQLLNSHESQELIRRGVEFKSILEANPDLIEAGEKYAAWFNDLSTDDDSQLIGILGIGADYHTAGIIPHNPDCNAMFYGASYVGYEPCGNMRSENPFPRRVTITFDGIRLLDKVFIYAVGEEKREVLKEIVEHNQVTTAEEIATKPALFLSSIGNVVLFTDVL